MTQRQREQRAREWFRPLSAIDATLARLGRHALAFALASAAGLVFYAAYVYVGFHAAPSVDGSLTAANLDAPVTIARDDRGIPHIVAKSARDAAFGQGFVEGSDRLFQMELTRRYATGTLSEVLGPKALAVDRQQRYYDVRDIAERQWRAMPANDREQVQAFADGVNFAMATQPLPVEFRLLLYRPRPWTPQDSLSVSLAISLALADSWRDVVARNQVWQRAGQGGYDRAFPLTDQRYDVSIDGRALPVFNRHVETPAKLAFSAPAPRRAGSNAWAAGGSHTRGGRALLANDPHLDLTIPGLWYLVDVRAPNVHVAGASIPGAPGVLLGHNDFVAWGATNADVAATSVFRAGALPANGWRREVFHVRFRGDVSRAYYRTDREFGVSPDETRGDPIVLVRWAPYASLKSPVSTFLALDRARDLRDAFGVLGGYEGTAENFVLADTHGQVGYHLAGTVVNDPAWGRYVHPATDLGRTFERIAFDALPGTEPSRDGTIVSANNKMYGARYPYRLSASFDPPYRAFRIAQLLRGASSYDAAYFARMQLDTVSPVDREFARWVSRYARTDSDGDLRRMSSRLASWDGSFARDSKTATIVHAMRTSMEQSSSSLYQVLQSLRAGGTDPNAEANFHGMLYVDRAHERAWGAVGAVAIEHPLAPLRFGFLNGATLPGDGDEYTIHLQEDGFSQSFRAVWETGNWDRGGIVIPSGESGEPGSGHYTDLTATWTEGRMVPLPFSERAVRAATRSVVWLMPRATAPTR